jgi:hypothetical protein
MWRRVALAAAVLAARPASAEDADPFAKIFNELRDRWSAIEKTEAQHADACAVGPAPRMSFQPVTTYTDVTAAMADGAVPRDDTANAYRARGQVLQLVRENGASVLTLKDENAKPVVSRSMTQACAPVSITAAPDGDFLVQVQGDRVLWLDGGDLQTKAIYRLTMPPKLSASSITLLPDNRLVATTAATPPSQSPVLVYNLSAPSPQ